MKSFTALILFHDICKSFLERKFDNCSVCVVFLPNYVLNIESHVPKYHYTFIDQKNVSTVNVTVKLCGSSISFAVAGCFGTKELGDSCSSCVGFEGMEGLDMCEYWVLSKCGSKVEDRRKCDDVTEKV